jgi:hypothetical protein
VEKVKVRIEKTKKMVKFTKERKTPTKDPSTGVKRTILDSILFVFSKNCQKKFTQKTLRNFHFLKTEKLNCTKNTVSRLWGYVLLGVYVLALENIIFSKNYCKLL